MACMQSKRKPAFFWINAMAPLTSVILGSVLVYLTHAEKHGVQVVSKSYKPNIHLHHMLLSKIRDCLVCILMQIGHLKKGLNPPSLSELAFGSPYLMTAIKTGVITGVIALAVSLVHQFLASFSTQFPHHITCSPFLAWLQNS